MSHKKIDTEQGHWILAKMGKKVLRPGGRELTEKLVDALKISKDDDFVEFAPGGFYDQTNFRVAHAAFRSKTDGSR